ncbi:AraC family transcriptional regulator [Pararobbsia silviterrae]|uniref:AraC family transcriptional regulator n=1 Tax=Pararobbsia silviterrae TaxID=1792498 RepID=A0A494Y4C0_9BURK|nr:helix-turn-helix transcriptional regulator [Pararobbsia silviterrae]RKP57589.1 AraC family transcriptional regulator [Pararobbsia silviterrae]
MTKAKLQTFGPVAGARPVIAQSIDYDDGAHEIAHVHHRAQLVHATTGIVRTVTPYGLWMLTSDHALLIGSQIEHELHMVGSVSMRTLYIEPDSLAGFSGECRVIEMSDLLRASVLGMFDPVIGEAERDAMLAPLILHLLQTSRDAPGNSRLPLPASARVRRICEALIANPSSVDTLERWGERVGASARTLARLFREETGMTFGQWREQLRLVEAVSKLATGGTVADVAQTLGYADARTFSVMFRRAFGYSPQEHRRRAGGGE